MTTTATIQGRNYTIHLDGKQVHGDMSEGLVPGVDYDSACCAICGTTGRCSNPQECIDSLGEWQGDDERWT